MMKRRQRRNAILLAQSQALRQSDLQLPPPLSEPGTPTQPPPKPKIAVTVNPHFYEWRIPSYYYVNNENTDVTYTSSTEMAAVPYTPPPSYSDVFGEVQFDVPWMGETEVSVS